MNYNTDNQLDMTFDEYTYNVDMMLMADFGEPATLEQLRHIGENHRRATPQRTTRLPPLPSETMRL